jgi:hypothetical protein
MDEEGVAKQNRGQSRKGTRTKREDDRDGGRDARNVERRGLLPFTLPPAVVSRTVLYSLVSCYACCAMLMAGYTVNWEGTES